jgi:hypothetical protein
MGGKLLMCFHAAFVTERQHELKTRNEGEAGHYGNLGNQNSSELTLGILRFEDLTLLQAAFEVRFEEACLLWDRAGVVWDDTLKVIPNLKRQHTEPSRVVFATLNKPQMELSIEIARLGVIEHQPDKRLEGFSEIVSKFADIAIPALGVAQYLRVGLRLIFAKEFSTPEAAAEAVLATGVIKEPVTPQLGITTPILQPECAYRREDGKNGFGFRFKAETLNFEFRPAFGWSDFSEPISRTKHRVNLDVDCYIQAPVSAETMRFVDWISQTFHIIKRDASSLIGG